MIRSALASSGPQVTHVQILWGRAERCVAPRGRGAEGAWHRGGMAPATSLGNLPGLGIKSSRPSLAPLGREERSVGEAGGLTRAGICPWVPVGALGLSRADPGLRSVLLHYLVEPLLSYKWPLPGGPLLAWPVL